MSLVVDLMRSLGQMSDPRFLRVLFGAVALTLAALAVVFWAVMIGLGWVLPETVTLPWIGSVSFVDNLLSWAAFGLMLALSVVLMVPAAAIVVGLFLDSIVAAVEARHYPSLPPVTDLGISEQIVDSAKFLGVVVGANLLALVVYFAVPPLAPFVFWLVNGYLLGREYFQLVAARRLGTQAAQDLRRRHFWRVWIAGTAMVVPLSVPVLNLVVPVLGVAVFTHQFHRLVPAEELR